MRAETCGDKVMTAKNRPQKSGHHQSSHFVAVQMEERDSDRSRAQNRHRIMNTNCTSSFVICRIRGAQGHAGFFYGRQGWPKASGGRV